MQNYGVRHHDDGSIGKDGWRQFWHLLFYLYRG